MAIMEVYDPEKVTIQDCLDMMDRSVFVILSNGQVASWAAEKEFKFKENEFIVPIDKRPRRVEKCYSMGIWQDMKLYPNSYVSELNEFSKSQQVELLAGEMVRVQESPERWVYICQNEK